MKKLIVFGALALVFLSCKKKVVEEVVKDQPIMPKIEENSIELNNSTWNYVDDTHADWKFEITFGENGKFRHTQASETDTTFNNDTWKKEGDKIVLNFNDSHATYNGKIVSEELIQGRAKNINDATWIWKLEKASK
jgi:hypothetical protein